MQKTKIKTKNIKKDRAVGVIIIDKLSREYLLIKHNKGHWGFPKGHQEKNELFIETGLRELFEETKIKADDVEIEKNFMFADNYSFIENTRKIKKEVFYYLGFVNKDGVDIKIQDNEIADYKWTDFAEAMNLINFPETQKLLNKLQFYLEQ